MKWRFERRTQLVLDALASISEDIASNIQRLEGHIMALADTLAELQSDDTELAADIASAVQLLQAQGAQIADLQTQLATLQANGTVPADQLAALQAVADNLAASHTTLSAALPTPAPPAG